MWKVSVYQGNEIILEHSQNEYFKVMNFAFNALAELMQKHVEDFRIVMQDREGNTYFSAIGEKTQITGMRKAGGRT